MPSNNNQPQPAPPENWPSEAVPRLDLRRRTGTEASSPPVERRPGPRFDRGPKSQLCSTLIAGQNASAASARVPHNLPAEIGFLVHYGIASGILVAAAAKARAQGVTADAVLLAEGKISEYHFYGSLARHLRLAFVDGRVRLGAATCYPQSIRAGLVPLAGSERPAFLGAPRGKAIVHLIAAMRRNGALCAGLALTTPTHLMELVRGACREEISRAASLGLWSFDPVLCAKDGANARQWCTALAIAMSIALSQLMAPAATSAACGILLSLAFIAVTWLRLTACAASLNAPAPQLRRLQDVELPIYSIVIALYREARIVPQLLAAMDRIDYPRAKLDVKFVIEEDDEETLDALMRADRLPGEVVVAPAGTPRTKPRALNVALPLLRGQFVVVFDAEDVPDPWQIKMAAQRFAAAPQRLACLQARLAIDNTGDGWLTRLFAIEYAVLFDVINVGFAALRLPFPLGGSSNHFRADVLRKLGGWDAWNVTEDADMGLRLARFGYYAETLPSTTYEEAPARLGDFVAQRRRWCKGWYQTLIVLCRNPRRLISEIGPARCGAAMLVLLSYALAPLAGPLYALWVAADLARGGLNWPSDFVQIGSATLWVSVFMAGIPAILWPAFQGMRRRGLLGLWPSLFLLPLYFLLICYAAWVSVYDLLKRPQHWHKTEHGLARSSRREAASVGSRPRWRAASMFLSHCVRAPPSGAQ
jgi:cellulose synthase/poly-beta-1,6-N-acetylglucosamine synthase-like glycosyltransferase